MSDMAIFNFFESNCRNRFRRKGNQVLQIASSEGVQRGGASYPVACKSCNSVNQRQFPAEINVHFPGPENFETPSVWVFPTLVVCLNCGLTEFTVCGKALQSLTKRNSKPASWSDAQHDGG